jgi:GLPGLI family protein
MKTKILAIAFLSFFTTLIAQRNEAHVIYDMSFSSDDAMIGSQLAMLKGSTMNWMFKGDKSRQEVKMGALATTTTISDQSAGKGLMLVEGIQGKTASWMDLNSQDDEEVNVSLIEETKEINGFTAHKAIVKNADGEETVIWYSKDFAAPEVKSRYTVKGVPGLPLAFEIKTPQMNMYFEVREIQPKVKGGKKLFQLKVPAGFIERPIEDLMK